MQEGLRDGYGTGTDYVTTDSKALCKLRSADFYIVEKFADMRYNKLLNFAGVTGDFDDSRFRERNAYEKWKKT